MNRHLTPQEAEHLLGGHAAGILTPEEHSALFQAALEHQAVFNALMDEEALREVLADPAARARLLAVLSESAPTKAIPFWRRHPALLGLAATALVAVTASLVTLRNPAPQLKTQPIPPQPEAAPVPEPPKLDSTPLPATPARSPRMQPPPVAAPLQETAPPVPVAGAVAPAQAAPPPAAVVEVVVPEARSKEKAAPAPEAARKAELEDRASSAKGGAALSATPLRAAEAKKKAALPDWWFEGRSLLVRHLEGQWVGLLRRSVTGPVLLPSQPLGPGLTRFNLGPEPGPWDLFVLPTPPEVPIQLPTEGPVDGVRARIPNPTPGH